MRVGVLLGLALLAVAPRTARGDDPPTPPPPATESFTLQNGLRVFIRSIPVAKGAFAQVLFTIGEEDDPPGFSGLSRVMANLYTWCRAGDELERGEHAVGREYDGRHEVEVNDDHTLICEGAPADRLRLVLREAAARMGDLRIEAEDVLLHLAFTAAGGNDPRLFLRLSAREEAIERLHPLPAAGRRGEMGDRMHEIDAPTIRERWRRYYKPANAILVVVGNLDAALVRAGVRRQFGPIPAGEKLVRSAGKTPLPLPDSPPAVRDALDREVAFEPWTGATTVALDVPKDPRGMVAAWILENRLQDRHVSFQIELLRALSRMGEGPDYREWSRPDVLTLTVSKEGSDESTATAIRRRLREAAETPITQDDRSFVRRIIEAFQATDRYPCRMASDIARRAQLGIDGTALLRALDELTTEDLRALASGPSAAVTVRPKPR